MANENGRFELPIRTVTIKFEGMYEGAEAVCSMDVSTDLFLRMQELADTDEVEKVKQAMELFGEYVLLDTNINVGGKPIEADAAGLLSLPLNFVREVFQHWAEHVKDDAAPLAPSQSE